MKDLPTVEKFKKLRDKYANEIIPLYANCPYRFLVEDYSRMQDLSDEDIDSMDLTTGEDGSHIAYNLLRTLCSTELSGILAQFSSQECAQEAYDLVSAIGGETGNPTHGELLARVFLKYFP